MGNRADKLGTGAEATDKQWFSVRCIFELDPRYGARVRTPPEHLYEERILLWHTTSFDAAIELAEKEAQNYVDDDGTYLGVAQAFALFDPPEDGGEVFSLMRDSDLPADEYLLRHFWTGTERAVDDEDPQRP